MVLSNVWKNSKSLKTRGNIFIPSFFFATDRNFLAVLDKGNLCSSPLHGLNVSIAYKGLDPNIVHMPKYVRHFLVIHI